MPIGRTSLLDPAAQLADDIEVGEFCVIGPEVHIGAGSRVMHHVELRSGTIVGRNVLIDSGVRSSGDCVIGDDVIVRYQAIIARGCRIGDGTFVAPQVCFVNLDTAGQEVGGAEVGRGCFIGTGAIIQAGISIAAGTVIGAAALVTASITRPGTYVGVPARHVDR